MYFIKKPKQMKFIVSIKKENSKLCRDLSVFKSYTKRLKNNQVMGKYRRTYQQKFMQIRKEKNRTKDNKTNTILLSFLSYKDSNISIFQVSLTFFNIIYSSNSKNELFELIATIILSSYNFTSKVLLL